jgi:hypothetical protein
MEATDKQSIEMSFQAPSAEDSTLGTFVGAGVLACPICGNKELNMDLKVKADKSLAHIAFYCDNGLGHLVRLEIGPTRPGWGPTHEVSWVLLGDDDPNKIREQLEEADF